tara:strand:+ start:1644 stop:1904 length:261 start_codon:yes stop_codon:yes gene_type:complete
MTDKIKSTINKMTDKIKSKFIKEEEPNKCSADELGCDCSCDKCINFGDCDPPGIGNRICAEFYMGQSNCDWCAECLFLSKEKRSIK